jgi:hypothetical protein
VMGEVDSPDGTAISGNMTLAEIEASYELSAQTLLGELGLPADTDTDKPIREILEPLGREVKEVGQTVAVILKWQADTTHDTEQQRTIPVTASQ